jgi:ubiquitin-protein ligase
MFIKYSKYVQKFCPLGIYIIPQTDNIRIWQGLITIRDGLYKNGIFKFEITIPDNYPCAMPSLKFHNKIIHKLIDKETGLLNLQEKFGSWQPGKNLIVNILFFVKDIFYNPIYLSTDNSEEIETNVNEIYSKIYEPSQDDSLKIEKLNRNSQLIYDKLKFTSENQEQKSLNERTEELQNWFLNSYIDIINE